MENYLNRLSKVLMGLFLYSFGIVFCIHANIGLAPWDAFGIGISNITNISYGNISIFTGVFILIVVVVFLEEKIGIGTILNTLLIGVIVDFIRNINIIPYMSNFFLCLIMLFIGQIIICFATYFYIGAGFGCGPRDSLMVALGKLFPNIPIGAIRGLIEGTVLVIGWILGAKIGLGTVITVFGIGFIMQTTFKLLKFNVTEVVHESLFETFNNLKIITIKSKKSQI